MVLVLKDRIADFKSKMHKSPRKMLAEQARPSEEEMVIKPEGSDQVIRFGLDGSLSVFASPSCGVKLFGPEGVMLLSASAAYFPGKASFHSGIEWDFQPMNPLLKNPASNFMALTPDVAAALVKAFAATGSPGVLPKGIPVFLPKPELKMFSPKTLKLLKEAGIKVPE